MNLHRSLLVARTASAASGVGRLAALVHENGLRRPQLPKTLPKISRNRLLALAALLVFVALSIGYSYARSPWWDEGLFTDVALNFRNAGHLGSPTLDPDGYRHFPAVQEYTYWQFPLYFISLGTWLHVVPPTALGVRLFSVAFGLLYILSWFVFIRSVTRNESLALLVGSVVALDYACVSAASDGRMDMMCAALGQAALAAYVSLRARNWNFAIAIAAFFGAAAFFSHPMGLIANCCLAVLVIMDWRQIRWQGLLAATAPFLLGGALCLRYVLEAPKIYLAQSTSASAYRISTLSAAIKAISTDAYHRYFLYYFAGLSGFSRFKVFCLLFGLAGLAALLLDSRLRKQPISRILLGFALIAYIGIAGLDNQDLPVYFVYSLPIFSACGAVWTYYCWKRRGFGRIIASALLASAMLSTITGFAYKIRQNDYRAAYLPVIRLIRHAVPPGGIVMGGSELGYALGFGPPLRDDRYLGFFSKLNPAVFVVNGYYGENRHLPWIWSRKRLARDFHLALENKLYKVYLRNGIHY